MIADEPLITAEEFLNGRFELPESGQWSELSGGRVMHFQPPDLDHGNTVLNLSKQLAQFAETSEGYPCFDLGLLLAKNPDTVWFPAVSYFVGGQRFKETDRAITETVPAAVIELASTADRREPIASRVSRYFVWGVDLVWVVNPSEKTIQVARSAAGVEFEPFGAADQLTGTGPLSGLSFGVGELFTEPAWWS